MIRNLLAFILVLSACTEAVPAGTVGRVRSPSGFNSDILSPGNWSCWGRDHLYLLETTDLNVKIPMTVLCDDSLNFKFTLDILVGVDQSNLDLIREAFTNIKPAAQLDGSRSLITVGQLSSTYVVPTAMQEAQKVVSKYKTSEIVENRAAIIEEVKTAVLLASKADLIRVKRVALTDLEFPTILTEAQELKAKRVIEIETQKAEGDKAKAKARAELEVAELIAQKKLLEAQSIADSNQIIGTSITPQYIAYEQIQAMSEAARGDNNVFLFPYKENVNSTIGGMDWTDKVLDATIREKLQKAMDSAKPTGVPFLNP